MDTRMDTIYQKGYILPFLRVLRELYEANAVLFSLWRRKLGLSKLKELLSGIRI